jgi:pyruvate dehydrogenase E2 component (dihydrolipoamide acetyltransferase)
MSAKLHSSVIDNSRNPATPVLFLHGFGGVGAQWWGLQTAVSFKAPTIAFDLPGHGKSVDFPDAGPPKIAARAVLAEMDARDISQAHFVGHSMGGAISSLIGLMAPERVASMTLLAPGGYGSEVNHQVLHHWAAAKTEEQLTSVMRHFFGPDYQIHPKMIDFQVDLRARTGAVEKLIEIADLLFESERQGALPVDDLLANKLSTSVIWGNLDAIVPVHQSDQLKDRVDLHIVDGMGHSPLEEAPDLVRDVVLRQLAAASS